MPGSTTIFGPAAENNEIVHKTPEATIMSAKQPPPVAPRTTSVSIQSWQMATSGDTNYSENHHARSASMDSLESSGSSSSGSIAHQNSTTIEYIPTRIVGKTPKLPSHNPLQFVKVQSPLCRKAEQQIKLTKEVKITREALKEGEEEWQSNLDNWKSRRRKVSEKVIQRAEEMRQIEAEEQLRQEKYLQQQRKIKKFSEIVEKRSSSRYNLDLYIGQGNDSGLGGTPEPDDTIDSQSSLLRSDTSEGMTSEAESVDSDIHKSDKIHEKEPPKVPQKPQKQLKKDKLIEEFGNSITSVNHFTNHLSTRDSYNFSSTEPSDVEGHTGDSETISSEEDISYLGDGQKSESIESNLCGQENYNGIKNGNIKENISSIRNQIQENNRKISEEMDYQFGGLQTLSFSISIKPGDNRGFGFTLKGGKDQGCSAFIENITKYSPADVTGLKEGDKIISLNGECASDYSHASLIFSIKQAVYAGILDIIISRSEKNTPMSSEIQKTTSRKSSFAEKLALFSSGVNSTTSNLEESKTLASSTKTSEGKNESLVLRRRSAFENGKKEMNVVHRRSSCLSQGISKTNSENVEKRLSVDLSQYNLPENGTSKKGPPPPVPVKPKIKPKTFPDLPKAESIKTNGYKENEHLNSNGSIHGSCNIPSDVVNHENLIIKESFSNKKDNESHLDEVEDNIKETNDNSLATKVNEEIKNMQHVSFSEYNRSPSPPINNVDINYSPANIENIETKPGDFITGENSESALNENSCSACVDNILPSDFTSKEICIEKEIDTNQKIECDSLISVSFTTSESFDSNYFRKINSNEDLTKPEFQSDLAENENYFSDYNNDYLDTDIPEEVVHYDLEERSNTYDLSENIENIKIADNDEITENTFENNEEDVYSFDNNMSIIDNSEENITNSEVNPSPLCLPLEKIDEDDVISASTTTSSETPDTETVIETLPSNLSPLPNDESNGEESSKPLSFEDKEREYVDEIPVPETSPCISSEPIYSGNVEYTNVFDNVPIQEKFAPNASEMYENNENSSPDDQDDEYCRELDESIDQITSLDVIDEIEQQLMHQLEQQGETFEEMDEGLTAQLEQDINKQWLYFSDEVELLDDLTPRNLEPPREPPPPPPPPELDTSDKKILPMTRTNSTKRIKKELWRRRSDFLGLDSPEGIDVDKILPPPPALEEILKQEREQTQWLEKRLSLAETDISTTSSYMNDSMGMEAQDFTQSEYGSEYFLEDPEGSSEISVDTSNEQWKENIDEQDIYGIAEFQQNPPVDEIIPISEESQKTKESPQHKAKQNLHNLGAAPKAKIMDSNKWITEKVTPVSKKAIEPVFRQITYNQNYWLTQEDERKRNIETLENLADRRYSMPPSQNYHPHVTVRTWGDREHEYQKLRPRSAVWSSSTVNEDLCDSYSHKQDIIRTHSLDSHRENYDSNMLESEAHKCASCGKGLCEGSAMGIEALQLYFHIECFRCCLCHLQLGNGSCGTDVQVKDNLLYCPNCFTVD